MGLHLGSHFADGGLARLFRLPFGAWVMLVGLLGGIVGLGGFTFSDSYAGRDVISSENSTGFHSPQEAARVLANAIDYARQAQLLAERVTAAKRSR